MDPIIAVSNLKKHFKIYKHHRGISGAIRNLFTRQYRLVNAVDDITFEVQRGELVGYLGPNGAGKSTTIKMLVGLLVPTSGGILVDGFIPWRDRPAYVNNIGAVFGQRTTLWWDLPVIESLEMLRHIYKIPPEQFRNNLLEFTRLLDLNAFLDTPVRSLSLGQRMRADICAAILHDPTLLFLDEPSIGLDVVAKERIREFITYLDQERGTTIILTTHDISEVEKVCRRVMIIDHGNLLYDGELSQLKERYGGKRQLIVEFAQVYQHTPVNGAEIIEHDGLVTIYHFSSTDVTASELIGRLSKRYRIRDLEVREPDIETTIRRIYEGRLLENNTQ
jgi:ABC-2 type transport system ATP-binding protein